MKTVFLGIVCAGLMAGTAWAKPQLMTSVEEIETFSQILDEGGEILERGHDRELRRAIREARRTCRAVGLDRDQIGQIRDLLELTKVGLMARFATIKEVETRYRYMINRGTGLRDTAHLLDTNLATLGSEVVSLTSNLRTETLFDIMLDDQRQPMLKCMDSVTKVMLVKHKKDMCEG